MNEKCSAVPFTMKLSHESVEIPQSMGHVLEQGRISTRKHTLDGVRERFPSSRREKDFLFQDKRKVGHPFGQPYINPDCELRQGAGTEGVVESKSSESEQKSQVGRNSCNDDDEIVKHMSNLPGFLQQVKKGNSIQEKALNFGVLNWKHLEKWKYNERMPGKNHKKISSSSSNYFSSVSAPPKMGRNLKSQPSSHGLNPSSSSSGRRSMPQDSCCTSHSSHLSSSKEERDGTYYQEQKNVDVIKSKGKETCRQESQATQSCRIHSEQDNFHLNVKIYDRSCSKAEVDKSKRKDFEKEVMSDKEASLLECGKRKLSLPSPDKINLKQRENEMRSFDDVDFTSDSCPINQQNFMPLNLVTSPAIDFDTCTGPYLSTNSEGKFSTMRDKTRRPSFLVEASSETKDEISKQPVVKGRHPSSSRRFSFDLGRMGRSFSFKETSAVPQLNSAYSSDESVPFRPDASSFMDNFERDNANSSSRLRSSSLRRLLDPLLKHKGAQPAETVQSSNGPPSLDRKPGGSNIAALLHLTLKDGLPSFKFVVNNSNEMLAADVKRFPASRKTDTCMIYAFYSIHEIRKKTMSWISRGSKSENCSLGYNIIGHMKISNYRLKSDSNTCVARECVLYGFDDPGKVDKENPKFSPNKEIAAVVVNNSSDIDFNEHCVEQNRNSNGTVVVLPGGLHGVPTEGSHSSLISRWRSGGLCDCGGWDVGCKLRILTDNKKTDDIFEALISSSTIDRLDLFVQGGKSKPVFSLELCSNGLYSIELDTSISLLEAFATCVAYVTCRKFSDVLDTKDKSDEDCFPTRYVACPPLSPVGRI